MDHRQQLPYTPLLSLAKPDQMKLTSVVVLDHEKEYGEKEFEVSDHAEEQHAHFEDITSSDSITIEEKLSVAEATINEISKKLCEVQLERDILLKLVKQNELMEQYQQNLSQSEKDREDKVYSRGVLEKKDEMGAKVIVIYERSTPHMENPSVSEEFHHSRDFYQTMSSTIAQPSSMFHDVELRPMEESSNVLSSTSLLSISSDICRVTVNQETQTHFIAPISSQTSIFPRKGAGQDEKTPSPMKQERTIRERRPPRYSSFPLSSPQTTPGKMVNPLPPIQEKVEKSQSVDHRKDEEQIEGDNEQRKEEEEEIEKTERKSLLATRLKDSLVSPIFESWKLPVSSIRDDISKPIRDEVQVLSSILVKLALKHFEEEAIDVIRHQDDEQLDIETDAIGIGSLIADL
ncbi:hypothetical protein ADUPG1_008594 [Aduncisulcus paluster]|uniref:Uncharacterized protein n=1 Tax=Aduncisulcus paluster TaxID=2918883 RepID=A0ABQ5KSJ3_9EUKA|nr:hypothetical protein ADUPG1_008594 [Aduncisulcus paluster]